MKAPLIFAALIMSVAVSAVYSLTLLDNLVNGSLYNYGLQFSYDWANPYWAIVRAIQALVALSVIFTLAFTIYVYRKCVYAKPQTKPVVREEQGSSAPEPQTEPNVCEVVSCAPELQVEPIVGEEVVSPSAPEPQIKPNVREEQGSPPPEPQPGNVPKLIKCDNCGNTFSQPLRRLDFLSDVPRIVNVCPACNREIKPVVSRGESERVEATVQKKKRLGKGFARGARGAARIL